MEFNPLNPVSKEQQEEIRKKGMNWKIKSNSF